MKKILIFTIFLLGFFVFATNENPTNCPTTDKGIVINGIRWATRNVDAPGTFAESPESPGMFFQWNRRRGWNTVGEEDWEVIRGRRWEAQNDPCPTGWRVPTSNELCSLRDVDSKWIILNGINGRFFGTYPHQIFLPTSRHTVSFGGWLGHYWSSSRAGAVRAINMTFCNHTVRCSQGFRPAVFTIRCVAK